MMISNLPVELQNKIFYYCAEHPCAKMIKQQIAILTKYESYPNNVSDSIGYYNACFKKSGIVKRWSSILHSIDDAIFYHRCRSSKPIHITTLLKSMSYPILTDIERTWVMNRFKIKNNRYVIL